MRPYPRGIVAGLGVGVFAAIQLLALIPTDGSLMFRQAIAIAGMGIAIAVGIVPTLKVQPYEARSQ
jgi:hypothetical protein